MLFLLGATGTIGRHLVELLGAGGVPTRALVRDPVKAAAVAAAGVEPVRGRLEDAEGLRRALAGAERLFLLTPAGAGDMAALQVAAVDAARAAGVRHVVKLSSIGADEDDTGARIIDAHRAVERHIERSGMAWTFLRPHWFMDNELGQAASIAETGTLVAPDVGRISAVDARDVAAAADAVLTSHGHEGRAYTLTGPQALSYADVAGALSRALGRPVRWQRVELAQARASMQDAGLPAVLAAGFTEIMARYRRGGVTARVSPAVQQLTGRPPRTFAQFAADHRGRFAHRAAAAA